MLIKHKTCPRFLLHSISKANLTESLDSSNGREKIEFDLKEYLDVMERITTELREIKYELNDINQKLEGKKNG